MMEAERLQKYLVSLHLAVSRLMHPYSRALMFELALRETASEAARPSLDWLKWAGQETPFYR